jgi:hypothetical protein
MPCLRVVWLLTTIFLQLTPPLLPSAAAAAAACVRMRPQVVQAPALSLAEMMALNPMMALQMQGIQQASVSLALSCL